MIKFTNLFESNNIEIERKFLVKNDSFKQQGTPVKIIQGYISDTDKGVVRIRVYGDKSFVTIKVSSKSIQRPEYEYEIPKSDALEIINYMCDVVIEKYRYEIPYNGFKWEVDEFLGDNDGLVVAEIELNHPEQKFITPDWIGREVTDDRRYSNSNLIKNPFKNW